MASQTGSIDLSAIFANKSYTEASISTKIDAVPGAGGIDLISNINAVADQINLVAQQINFGSSSNVFDELNEIKNAISIDTTIPSVTIGDILGFHIVITDSSIDFYQGSNRVAYMNGSALYVANSLSFGHYIFYERENGHFTLKRTN